MGLVKHLLAAVSGVASALAINWYMPYSEGEEAIQRRQKQACSDGLASLGNLARYVRLVQVKGEGQKDVVGLRLETATRRLLSGAGHTGPPLLLVAGLDVGRVDYFRSLREVLNEHDLVLCQQPTHAWLTLLTSMGEVDPQQQRKDALALLSRPARSYCARPAIMGAPEKWRCSDGGDTAFDLFCRARALGAPDMDDAVPLRHYLQQRSRPWSRALMEQLLDVPELWLVGDGDYQGIGWRLLGRQVSLPPHFGGLFQLFTRLAEPERLEQSPLARLLSMPWLPDRGLPCLLAMAGAGELVGAHRRLARVWLSRQDRDIAEVLAELAELTSQHRRHLLQQELADAQHTPAVGAVALWYSPLHLVGLERRLTRDLGYVEDREWAVQWQVAAEVSAHDLGLSPRQLQQLLLLLYTAEDGAWTTVGGKVRRELLKRLVLAALHSQKTSQASEALAWGQATDKEYKEAQQHFPLQFKDPRHQHLLQLEAFIHPSVSYQYLCDRCEAKGEGTVYVCMECDYCMHPHCAVNQAGADKRPALGAAETSSKAGTTGPTSDQEADKEGEKAKKHTACHKVETGQNEGISMQANELEGGSIQLQVDVVGEADTDLDRLVEDAERGSESGVEAVEPVQEPSHYQERQGKGLNRN
eukprot:g73575.t1